MKTRPPVHLEGDDRRLAPGSWYAAHEVRRRTGASPGECRVWTDSGLMAQRECPAVRRLHPEQRYEYARGPGLPSCAGGGGEVATVATPTPRVRRTHREVRSLEELRRQREAERQLPLTPTGDHRPAEAHACEGELLPDDSSSSATGCEPEGAA